MGSIFVWIIRDLVVVQSLSHVRLFETPRTAARPTSLSFTVSWSLLKLMSIESMTPSDHLVLCHSLLLLPSIFLSIRVFSNESALLIKWPSIGTSVSASVLPMNSQDWFPLRLTSLISLLSKGPSESSPAPQFESINSSAFSLLHGSSLTSVHDYW